MKNIVILSALFLAFGAQAESLQVVEFEQTIAGNNNVGLSFMKEVVKEELKVKEKNVLTSPLSLYYALSLAYNGAAGKTLNDLSQYLGSPYNTVADFNADAQGFQKSLIIEEKAAVDEWSPKPPVFGLANSAWYSTNTSPTGGTFQFAKNYVETLEDVYSAEVQGLDFKDPQTADVINQWAEDKTRGLIKKVLEFDQVKDIMWVLMNATYIEASWIQPFTPVYDFNPPKFNLLDGNLKDVDMIQDDGNYAFATSNEASFIEVPLYGTETSFFIALPNDVGMFKTLRTTGDAWNNTFWNDAFIQLNNSTGTYLKLVLPKFAFDYSVSLKMDDPLAVATGLNFLFQDDANFSAMAEPGSVPTKVGLIKQDTRIELDEYGIKAAAVTTIGGIETTSVPVEPPFTMLVDRPFFFAIANKKTGAIYFLGSVVNP